MILTPEERRVLSICSTGLPTAARHASLGRRLRRGRARALLPGRDGRSRSFPSMRRPSQGSSWSVCTRPACSKASRARATGFTLTTGDYDQREKSGKRVILFLFADAGETDLYLFGKGDERRIYEKLGAQLRSLTAWPAPASPSGRPNARRISVVASSTAGWTLPPDAAAGAVGRVGIFNFRESEREHSTSMRSKTLTADWC